MDLALVIRQRLEQLGLEQRDLAGAAQVTESYVSQLLTRKKAPPAPNRSDIYDKMGRLLKLPNGELAKLADLQRQEGLKRKLGDPPAPLFKEVRELVLRKCKTDERAQIRAIFEKQPFGELERLVTQKLLDVVKRVAEEELENENWLRLVARLSNRTYEQTRVATLEFLDADVLDISIENCVSFLDPLIESWDIDLATFAMEIVLNRRIAPGQSRKFEFVEKEADRPFEEEPGLKEFLKDPSFNPDATRGEIEFLKKLRFKERRPTALYYYRELQNLRDPLHFRGR
ncbi:MAG: helix-turn-helix transcriptional regulator [Acidobacteriia bacterium]|nr:helix-turn-helix transcriptional regulator [Terriglobia bacterium]